MRSVSERRIGRLESPSGVDFAEQLGAARLRRRDDPAGARRDAEGRRRRFLAECARAAAEARDLSNLRALIGSAHVRMDAAR